MLALYDVERHAHFVDITNDPKCDALIWAGYWRWALGYPDQARQAAEEQLALARRLAHPFNLCWSLTGGALAPLLRGETALVRQWAREAQAIARENAMSFVANMTVPLFEGAALVEEGVYADGLAKVERALNIWRVVGGVHTVPIWLHVLASASIGLRRFDDAHALLREALDLIDRTGHRVCEAEIYRVLGRLQHQQPVSDIAAAELSYRKAIEVARSQNAKGFELRATTSHARLWQSQGRHKEAYDLLAPVYGWFTEGFDTKDLREAKQLLDELA